MKRLQLGSRVICRIHRRPRTAVLRCRRRSAATLGLPVAIGVLWLAAAAPAAADTFTVRTSQTESETFEGHVYGESEEGVLSLMKPDGQMVFAPAGAVTDRQPGETPSPMTPEEVAASLRERFGEDVTHTHLCEPFVVALALAAPLEVGRESAVKKFFAGVESFVLNFHKSFGDWAEKMGLPHEEPAYPLVMVIFETDEQFEAYAEETMRGDGLSATMVTGFYSAGTNWLAVRLDECDNFQLPLHEGIHQQVFNRGWYKRMAPVPVWFNEGIATGFENDGAVHRGDPREVSPEFLLRSTRPMEVSFEDVITDDASFRGDVLAGDAYTRAWALHWLLVNRREKEYVRFVEQLGRRESFEQVPAGDRLKEFEETFGIPVAELQQMYEREVTIDARKQRVKLPRSGPDGRSIKQNQGGLARVFIQTDGRVVKGYGDLRNINPFRSLDFRVQVLPTGAPPIVWIVRDLGAKRLSKLPGRGQPVAARTFRLEVESALPGSEKAKSWGEDPGR